MGVADEEGNRNRADRWLRYNNGHRVLICSAHGYAISSIHGHLSDQHPDIKSKERNAIIARYAGVEIRGVEDVKADPHYGPSNPIPAVKGLREHPTWNVNSRERQWSLVRVQTFFTGPKRAIRYFCVITTGDDTNTAAATPGIEAALGTGGQGSPPGGVKDNELVAGIKERWACGQDRQEEIQKVLADSAAKHKIINWLRRSGWTAHFVGRDLGEIHASSQMPGLGEEEARRLIAATDRLFFNRCVAGLRSMPLMTRLLLASPHPKDAHSRPFGPLQEKTSIDRYVTYWKRFLCYCLRVLLLDEAMLLERHGFYLLWHFIAVLGIDGELGQLRLVYLFTYVLAGLVYVGRALLLEFAIPARERGTIKDLEGRFAAVRNEWLCKATYSPMGYTLSLLLYGKKIARETGSRLMVFWNRQCDLIYFMGKPIAMDAIRSIVAEMITNAENILWGELMFKEGHDVRFTIPLNTIEDNLTYTHRGKSFIYTNGLEGKEVEMLEDLVRSRRKSEFLDPGGEWRWEGIRKYQKSVRKFEELLVVFVIDGDVVLVTQYHKSLAHFDSPKVIPRIVPPRVGQLLAMYMVYYNENGPWEGVKISKAMAKWTHYYIGKHTCGKQADTKGDSDDGLGLDLNEAEQYKVPDDLAAAHSTATAANYSVTADILKRLIANSLKVFGRVSRQWHRFLNLDQAPCIALTASRKRRASTAAKPEETLVRTPAKRPKPLLLRRPGEYKGDMILAGLQAVLRNTPLVAVLPTGSGKSLVFMVPAILAGAGVTIVVAPFAELKRQLVSRCADAGLECKQWPEAQDVWLRVIVILAEAACYLTFTAADKYHGKLRDLNPLYIRALSHRLNVRYSIVRVKNGRGIAKVKKLVLSRWQDLVKGEKGVVYCASYANDSNAHFFAQRKEGFQAWLEGTTLYIVATAALGMGIDVPGRAGRAGERVQAEVIVEDKDWPSEDASKDGYLEVKVREVNSLVRTRGCRRRLLRQYLDSDLRDCKALEAVMCDNYEQESWVWKSELSLQGLIIALEEIEELGKPGCRVCWMFKGAMEARYYLYIEGFKLKGALYWWKHVQLAGREFKGEEDFCGWLGRKHAKLVCSKEMTNAMAMFNLMVE
ncbi:hypothetical protein CC79DRAFT_1390855 [Sarocladium strictum]